MKSIYVITAALAAFAVANPLEKRSCNADNCLRAVRGAGSLGGTSQPVKAMSDCSSFLDATSTVTVTPTTSTIYQTSTGSTTVATTVITSVTVTVSTTSFTGAPELLTPRAEATGVVLDNQIERRSSAGSIPTYASACSNAAHFISACSCIGIYSTTVTVTTTLPTVSATVTVLTTSTSSTATTTTALATQTAYGPFRIQASGANVDGQYLQDQQRSPDFNVPYFTSDPTSAVTCTLGPDRLLVCDSLAAAIYGCGQFFEVDSPEVFGNSNTYDLYCDIAADDQLTCDPVVGSTAQSNLFYSCTSGVSGTSENYLMQGIYCETDCLPVTVYAAPL